jgi:hypothetical protein
MAARGQIGEQETMNTTTTSRPLHTIARDIQRDWSKPN